MRANVLISIFLMFGMSLWGQKNPATLKNLTFGEALGISLQNNHLIKQYSNKSLQLEQELKATRGLHMPRISLSASYVYMPTNISLDLTPVRDAITPLYSALGNFGKFSGVPNPAGGLLSDDVSTAFMRG